MTDLPQPQSGKSGVVFAWLLTLAQWTTGHLSFVLSTACGISALLVSYYTIKAKRAEIRRGEAQDEHMCELCDGPGFQCPYPVHERPPTCKLKRRKA